MVVPFVSGNRLDCQARHRCKSIWACSPVHRHLLPMSHLVSEVGLDQIFVTAFSTGNSRNGCDPHWTFRALADQAT